MRARTAAVAVLFLAAHLVCLPPTLEDIDSINFALGVRDFDVARHQPHPPGYPVFIVIAKGVTAALDALGVPAADVRGLSLTATLGGAALVLLLVLLFLRLSGDAATAWWGMAIAICSPLLWFTSLRPLSDVAGLALAVAAQLLLASVILPSPGSDHARSDSRDRGMRLIAGAALAALAVGVRSQTAVLTLPLLAAALLWPRCGLAWRARVGAGAAGAVTGLAWGVPMLVVTGGLDDYLVALGTQAGEDFSGVVMLWTHRSARVAADAFYYTFVSPWGATSIAAIVLLLATAGAVRLMMRAPASAAVLLIGYAPYGVFHLLFQETVTVRYALPLVLPTAFLAANALAAGGGRVLTAGGATLAAIMLILTVPATGAYARDGSPVFRAFEDAVDVALDEDEAGGMPALGMHGVMRRVAEWDMAPGEVRALPAPHGREWLELVSYWRENPGASLHFVADPRRTDLALFDPQARNVLARERWTFPEDPFVGGVRPGAADVYSIQPPGWMLDRGWALTAEVGGVSERMGAGPHAGESIAWIRARPGGAALLLGGRHLGGPTEPAARLTVAGPSGILHTRDVSPGFFLHVVEIPAGALAGSGYIPLKVSARAADDSGRPVRVSLEQFDLQTDAAPMFGLDEGWGEPEYSPATGLAWRWMSERAIVWVRPIGRDVTLTIAGESPLRYFDRPPVVRVVVNGREVASFSPSDDFEQSVTLPSADLAAAGGRLRIESDLWFTPAADGEADRRRLALRLYRIGVR